jgi:alanyl-tRNA synthetase
MRDIDELRERFLAFFREEGHVIVPPSSLVPDDPSVLLTTAGMQQFKPYYTGERDPFKDIHGTLGKPLGSARVASVQPCVRTSDIDDVGDATHLTFFEMCGNFSFQGAYFKREAMSLAWRFLTETIGIPPRRFAVTVFEGDRVVPEDTESRALWREIGIPDERIYAFGRSDNFWGPTGKEGPCGPTTEIHYDRTMVPCERGEECGPNCPCGRYLELWNLVFNEYYLDGEGKLTKLSSRGVDTGMGLERLAIAVFDVPDVFATPFFEDALSWIIAQSPLFSQEAKDALEGHRVQRAIAIAESEGEAGLGTRGARIIADHLRASMFLIAEGILPSNLERGYILRRLIRRAVLYARLLTLPPQWVPELLERTVKRYGRAYPKVVEERARIEEVVFGEMEKFEKGLSRGLREFDRLVEERRKSHEPIVGEDLFFLFETYGFPVELSAELASAEGVAVDMSDLEEVRKRHREKSRAGATKKFGGHGLILDTGEIRAGTEEEVAKVTRLHTATHLLQAALRVVLGPTVEQRGSDITPERLRFDFSFPRKVSEEELRRVEEIVNEKIREDLPVTREEMPFEEAVASGALAFARGTYPKIVSVYRVGDFSQEVCGGPHVRHTAEVGAFRIVKEEASAAGVRRIRAVVTP